MWRPLTLDGNTADLTSYRMACYATRLPLLVYMYWPKGHLVTEINTRVIWLCASKMYGQVLLSACAPGPAAGDGILRVTAPATGCRVQRLVRVKLPSDGG